MDFFWKNSRFSGRTWSDWGNTARADMAGLGSIGYLQTGVLAADGPDVGGGPPLRVGHRGVGAMPQQPMQALKKDKRTELNGSVNISCGKCGHKSSESRK